MSQTFKLFKMGKILDPFFYNKEELQKTLILLRNAPLNGNIRNNVFKYQFESYTRSFIQLLPRKRQKHSMFVVNYQKVAYDLKWKFT